MNHHCKFFILLLFLGIQFISSCDSDNEKNVCWPLTLKYSAYTEEYVYNAAHKVETILYHIPNAGTRTGKLDYNDKGQLIRLTLFDFDSPPQAYNTYELTYDSEEKPRKLHFWGFGADPSGPPADVSNFYHDERQRLIKVEHLTHEGSQRYEYDANDNVTKVFRLYETEELLYAENLSFDSNPRIFSLVPELETLTVYMEGYVPGKNNITAAEIHDDQPGYPKVSAQNVTYAVDYNEKGFITSCQPSSFFVLGSLYFEEVTYRCSNGN